MQYINYNGTKISKLSLGTVQFGINYGIANKIGQPKQENINKIMKYIIEKGINSLDTAQGYGNSEEVLGNYLKIIDLNNLHIVSKIDSKELIFENEDFINSIQESINKLQVKSLFGLLMHNSNLMDKWNNNFSYKISLLKEKKLIKYFGVSIYTNDEFEMALKNKDINIIQIPFNILDQRALKNNWFEKAKKKNKFIFIRSIYLQGLLLMDIDDIPEKLVDSKQYIKKINNFSKQLNITTNELCLSFVNGVAKDSSLLFGCETLFQAQQNLDIFDNIKELDNITIQEMIHSFKNVSESIYNPTKW